MIFTKKEKEKKGYVVAWNQDHYTPHSQFNANRKLYIVKRPNKKFK